MTAVCFVLPSFAGGGAERVLLTVMAHLDRARFSASLVVLSGGGPLSDAVPSDVRLVDLKRPRLRQALPALRRKLRNTMPDLVISTMGHLNAGILSIKPFLPNTIRYVVREANVPLEGLSGSKRQLQSLAYRRLYHRAEAVVCPSRRVKESVAKLAPRAATALSVIHNPVDETLIRHNARNPFRIPGTGLRLVAVGRLTAQKGFDRIVDLMSEMPKDAHLTIIGDGPEREALSARIEARSLANQILLAGFSENPWAAMAGADALLLPSRWEGLPNVALEALACGTPVIATPEAGGIGDIADLAPTSVTLLNMGNDFLAGMIGLSPRATPSKPAKSQLPGDFSMEAIIPQYENLFAAVASR